MRLYQHSARCPAALRAFLDCNPRYWCFIPRPATGPMLDNFNSFGEPRTRVSETDHLLRSGVIEDRQLVQCLDGVPPPPVNYTFSYQDRQQQRFFFKDQLSPNQPYPSYIAVDLFQIAVVAVRKSMSDGERVDLLFSSSTGRCFVSPSIHDRNTLYRTDRNRTEHDLLVGRTFSTTR